MLAMASLTLLSDVSLAGMTDSEFNRELALLHSRARMADKIGIAAISQSVFKLVQDKPEELSNVVSSVLAQRASWTDAELYSIVRASLIAYPAAYNEVKSATINMNYEVMKKYGLSAATFTNPYIIELWQSVAQLPQVGAKMFNIAFTQIGTNAVGFAHATVYPLDVLDNLIYGGKDITGENPPIIPVVPPTSNGF